MFSDLDDVPTGTITRLRRGTGAGRASSHRLTNFRDLQAPEWWSHPSTLVGSQVTLRALAAADAPSLAEALGSSKVEGQASPGLVSADETAEFIAWAQRALAEGHYLCYGVVPAGTERAVGLFQIWPLEPSFRTAEWGFALAPRYWGSGLFEAGARLMMTFAFETLGVERLEARAAIDNRRANAALRKIGAVPEAVLRKCYLARDQYRDHVMWAILADEWRDAQAAPGDRVRGEVA